MRFLFVHQNFPAQFVHMAKHLAAAGHEVLFACEHQNRTLPGVKTIQYEEPKAGHPESHHYIRGFERQIRAGQQLARILIKLKQAGARPDIIIGHAGWGELLFAKDIFPDVPVIGYAEFYYRAHGSDVGFDPANPATPDTPLRVRMKNAAQLFTFEAIEAGLSPTWWQARQYPEILQHKIAVTHDGVDVDVCRPDPAAEIPLPDGRSLPASTEIVTYIARNLEPYRGFPTFMRAIPKILAARPEAQIVLVGGDGVSYGSAPKEGGTWRDLMLKEVSFDPARVHFLGNVPYPTFLKIIQASSAHVYLTYPFVLSWSMIEAMSSEALVIGSRTPPVEEVIVDGENGLLVDFFDPDQLSDRVVEALAHPGIFAPLRRRARQTVLERYALKDCLGRQLKLVEAIRAGFRPTAQRPIRSVIPPMPADPTDGSGRQPIVVPPAIAGVAAASRADRRKAAHDARRRH